MASGQPTLFLALTLLLLLLCAATSAYKIYQGRIPNGDFVPHPCWPGFTWHGVGHENRMGSGERNPFGKDFEENGFKWDECLCQRDSDGDGKTNGQELGDPDCVWVEGTVPAGKSTSHPGVCEPLHDPKCTDKNEWDLCTAVEFECEYLNTTKDVHELGLTLPDKTPVPSDKTTYMCQTFALPDDDEFHLIAYEPLIDNAQVAYHIVLHGCPDDMEVDDSPRNCESHPGDRDELCLPILAPWAISSLGLCMDDRYGFRIGQKGFRRVMMQVHWNNPTESSTFVDSSGLKLYYTSHLRPNDAGTLRLGQTLLFIPPGEDKVVQSGTCDDRCTADVPNSIFLTTAVMHMHYLGIGGSLRLRRNGEDLGYIINDEVLDYDAPPITHVFDPPVEVKPGDAVDITCVYESKTRTDVTRHGKGASEEFCMSFVTYYPYSDIINSCMNYGGGVFCPTHASGLSELTGDCKLEDFFAGPFYANTSKDIVEQCADEECSLPCKDLILETRKDEECLGDWIAQITEPVIAGQAATEQQAEAIRLLHTCDKEIFNKGPRVNASPGDTSAEDDEDCPFTSGAPVVGSSGLGAFLMGAIVFTLFVRF